MYFISPQFTVYQIYFTNVLIYSINKTAFACCSYSITDGASDINRQSLCTMKAPKEQIEVQ